MMAAAGASARATGGCVALDPAAAVAAGPDAEAGAGTPDELAGADFPSQAYSAPESEHITIAPYVPADTDLYDYDSYRHEGADDGVGVAGPRPPRWPRPAANSVSTLKASAGAATGTAPTAK